VTLSAHAKTLARLCFQGAQSFRAVIAERKIERAENSREYLRKLLANQIASKKSSESQTAPIQPRTNTSKDEETKMAKKVKKASKKPAKKTAAKTVRKAAKKTVRKAAKRKPAKKAAKKTVRKAAKRKTVRKAKKAVAASM
jgi:hypothetical protein